MLIKVAFQSLTNRKTTICLTIFAIAISAFVILGVEHLRQQAKISFQRTISNVDLIIGARTVKPLYYFPAYFTLAS